MLGHVGHGELEALDQGECGWLVLCGVCRYTLQYSFWSCWASTRLPGGLNMVSCLSAGSLTAADVMLHMLPHFGDPPSVVGAAHACVMLVHPPVKSEGTLFLSSADMYI